MVASWRHAWDTTDLATANKGCIERPAGYAPHMAASQDPSVQPPDEERIASLARDLQRSEGLSEQDAREAARERLRDSEERSAAPAVDHAEDDSVERRESWETVDPSPAD